MSLAWHARHMTKMEKPTNNHFVFYCRHGDGPPRMMSVPFAYRPTKLVKLYAQRRLRNATMFSKKNG
eukprot:scaffold1772_cov80-Cylindrotheca_fusiformis.AAC.10